MDGAAFDRLGCAIAAKGTRRARTQARRAPPGQRSRGESSGMGRPTRTDRSKQPSLSELPRTSWSTDATTVDIADVPGSGEACLAPTHGMYARPRRIPLYRVVDRMAWTGTKHTALHDQLVDLARNV